MRRFLSHISGKGNGEGGLPPPPGASPEIAARFRELNTKKRSNHRGTVNTEKKKEEKPRIDPPEAEWTPMESGKRHTSFLFPLFSISSSVVTLSFAVLRSSLSIGGFFFSLLCALCASVVVLPCLLPNSRDAPPATPSGRAAAGGSGPGGKISSGGGKKELARGEPWRVEISLSFVRWMSRKVGPAHFFF